MPNWLHEDTSSIINARLGSVSQESFLFINGVVDYFGNSVVIVTYHYLFGPFQQVEKSRVAQYWQPNTHILSACLVPTSKAHLKNIDRMFICIRKCSALRCI